MSFTLSRPLPLPNHPNHPIEPDKPGQRPYLYQDQVIRLVAERTRIPEQTVRRVVTELIDAIRESVGHGVEVRLSVLGTFFPLWQGPKGDLPGRWLAGLKVSRWFFQYLNPDCPPVDQAAPGDAWAPGEK